MAPNAAPRIIWLKRGDYKVNPCPSGRGRGQQGDEATRLPKEAPTLTPGVVTSDGARLLGELYPVADSRTGSAFARLDIAAHGDRDYAGDGSSVGC